MSRGRNIENLREIEQIWASREAPENAENYSKRTQKLLFSIILKPYSASDGSIQEILTVCKE